MMATGIGHGRHYSNVIKNKLLQPGGHKKVDSLIEETNEDNINFTTQKVLDPGNINNKVFFLFQILPWKKKVKHTILGIVMILVIFSTVGSSVNLASSVGKNQKSQHHFVERKTSCDKSYHNCLIARKCGNALLLFSNTRSTSQPHEILHENLTKIQNFLNFCVNYETNYTIRFYYYPYITLVKNKKGIKSFLIDDCKINTNSFFDFYYFINKK